LISIFSTFVKGGAKDTFVKGGAKDTFGKGGAKDTFGKGGSKCFAQLFEKLMWKNELKI
jgi:hypothetical protein